MAPAVRLIEGVFVRGREAQTRVTSQLSPGAVPGRAMRVARLMALALRFEELVQRHEVRDYAALARLGHVSRARITQIMNLLLLAPDIQEEILFLPRVERGYDPIHLRQLQPIALTPSWAQQRQRWHALIASTSAPEERREKIWVNCLEVAFRSR